MLVLARAVTVRPVRRHGLPGLSWLLSVVMMKERMRMRKTRKEKRRRMTRKRRKMRMTRKRRMKRKSRSSEGKERSQLHPHGRFWTLTVG